MILSFRTWWRILAFLGALALLPLAWRGLEREPPILIQQIPAESRAVPPGLVALSPPVSAPRPGGGPVAEAAGEPPVGPAVGGDEPVADAAGLAEGLGGCPCAEAAEPVPVEAEGRARGTTGTPGTGDPPSPPTTAGETVRVNINSADAATLETLPGIGPALAGRIIEYRERWGPFTAPEQLTEVSGIGEKRLEQLLPWITVE